MVSYMLENPAGQVAQHFTLNRLVNHQAGPWMLNQYNYQGSPSTGTYRYEAVIAAASGGETPASIKFVPLPVAASIAGRHIYYNRSRYDGDNAAANASDDQAIAINKTALLPGQSASFENYTSYSRGINGIMVDIANLAGTVTAADLAFKAGNDGSPSGWAAAPSPTLLVRPGAGNGGSTRIHLVWADNAIEKKWLQVTVKANANTGLPADDVFYFGNAIGESGNSTTDARVTAVDEIGARAFAADLTGLAASVAILDAYDYNRDGFVNAQDESSAGLHYSNFINAINLISVPGTSPAIAAALPWAAETEGRKKLRKSVPCIKLRSHGMLKFVLLPAESISRPE